MNTGSSVIFHCQAAGIPEPVMSWQRYLDPDDRVGIQVSVWGEGQQQSWTFLVISYISLQVTYLPKFIACKLLQNDNKYELFSNGSLLISNVVLGDEMFYSCVAENNLGAAIKTVTLSIAGKFHGLHSFCSLTCARRVCKRQA